jgi:hypothetical protein
MLRFFLAECQTILPVGIQKRSGLLIASPFISTEYSFALFFEWRIIRCQNYRF